MQEKKPKSGSVHLKSANEAKRLEKDYKRLQLELSKERDNYAKMHKQLNQEIQYLKEELDKREQDMLKFKSNLNASISVSNNSSNQNINNANNQNRHHQHHHHSGLIQALGNGLQAVNNVMINSLQNMHSSPSLSSSSSSHNSNSIMLSSIIDDTTGEFDGQQQHGMEGWLSIPNKRNIKKHGWKKLYVVLRKGKLLFYNSLKVGLLKIEKFKSFVRKKSFQLKKFFEYSRGFFFRIIQKRQS